MLRTIPDQRPRWIISSGGIHHLDGSVLPEAHTQRPDQGGQVINLCFESIKLNLGYKINFHRLQKIFFLYPNYEFLFIGHNKI